MKAPVHPYPWTIGGDDVHSYDDLDPSPQDTDRWADDDALRCWLADDGGCGGAVENLSADDEPLFLCEQHLVALMDAEADLLAAQLSGGAR